MSVNLLEACWLLSENCCSFDSFYSDKLMFYFYWEKCIVRSRDHSRFIEADTLIIVSNTSVNLFQGMGFYKMYFTSQLL